MVASTVATGDEREPQMPNGVLDTQECDDKIGIEQRPMSGAVNSEPEMMEDADTYVRRMMKSRGIEMPDMPNNDA